MKTYLLAALLTYAIPALAQTAPTAGQELTTPFKKANVILIHTADSASSVYGKLAKMLLADGYAIDKSDKEIGYINTAPRLTTASRGVQVTLRFTITASPKGTTIEERGTGFMSVIGSFPLEYREAAANVLARGWAEMMRVASLYPSSTATYKQQP